MTNGETLIKVVDLHKHFIINGHEKLNVLKGISQEISKGEVVSIIGPSGGGKSTFLRCLNLMEVPDQGQIIFEGLDITQKGINLNEHRQKMGYGVPALQYLPEYDSRKEYHHGSCALKEEDTKGS